jgi:outer membrane protein OmpA-like peptidoglycan-associated protein
MNESSPVDSGRTKSEERPSRLARLWGDLKSAFTRSEKEARIVDKDLKSLAWVWCEFNAERPQSDDECCALHETPAPLAWTWSTFKAELPQSDGERRVKDEAFAPLAWVWSRFRGEHWQSEDERRVLRDGPAPMAWLWSAFEPELPQSDGERRAKDEAFAPLAWVWSQFRGEHWQSEDERRVLRDGPAPMAWLWSAFKPELPQSDDERRAKDEAFAPLAWVWSQFRGEHPQDEEEWLAASGAQQFEEIEWIAETDVFELSPAGTPDEASRTTPYPTAVTSTLGKQRGGRSLVWLSAAAATIIIAIAAGLAWRVPATRQSSEQSPKPQKGEARATSATRKLDVASPDRPAPVQTPTHLDANEAVKSSESALPAPAQQPLSSQAANPLPQLPEKDVVSLMSVPQVAAKADDSFTPVKLPSGAELYVSTSGVEIRLLDLLQHTWNRSDEFFLDGISFDPANGSLSPSSSDQMQTIATILKAYPKARIKVNAYVQDGPGKAVRSRILQKRAYGVLRELARLGVENSRIAVQVHTSKRNGRSRTSEADTRRDQRISIAVTKK